jgi:hypothetical protein
VVKIIIILFISLQTGEIAQVYKKCFVEKAWPAKKKKTPDFRGLFYQKLVINFF